MTIFHVVKYSFTTAYKLMYSILLYDYTYLSNPLMMAS